MMECKKRLDPTMERGKETEDKLHQQYRHLQQEWDTIKQSKSKPRISRRPSTYSRTMVKHLQLLDNSPRNLMSSLQNRSPPSEGGGGRGEWKVRNNDLAIEDIQRERKAAIESGKLKGRRLFEAVEVDFAGREEIICSGYWDGFAQDSEVRSVCSYDSDNYHENENIDNKEGLYPLCCHCCSYSYSSSSSSSSFLCDECIKRVAGAEEGEKVVMVENVEEKKAVVNVEGGYYRRRGMVLMSWIVIGLIVCAISIIKKRGSFGGYGDRDDDVILVPT